MTMSADYKYATGDLLEKPNTYFYSVYQGEAFVSAWARSRAELMMECSIPDVKGFQPVKDEQASEDSPTGIYLTKLLDMFATRTLAKGERKNLDAILRNFEAKKRIYRDYNAGFTSKDRTDYHELGLYVLFSELMVAAYRQWQELPYLNALIKCLDILSAHHRQLLHPERVRIRSLVEAEKMYIEQLAQRLGVNIS